MAHLSEEPGQAGGRAGGGQWDFGWRGSAAPPAPTPPRSWRRDTAFSNGWMGPLVGQQLPRFCSRGLSFKDLNLITQDWKRRWGQHPRRPVRRDAGAAADARVLSASQGSRTRAVPSASVPQAPPLPARELRRLRCSVDPVSKRGARRLPGGSARSSFSVTAFPSFTCGYVKTGFLLFPQVFCSKYCSVKVYFFSFLPGGFSQFPLPALKCIPHKTHLKVNRKSDLESCV